MFLPKLASDDRSPWGSFWFEPVSTRSAAGVRVSPDQAMRLAAVYACVQILAKTFAVAPFKLYSPAAKGGRTPITDHWAYKLIAKRPNQWQNPFEWRQMGMGHLALRGNSYNEIYDNASGEITDLIPRHPDRVTPEVMPSGDYRYLYKELDGSTRIIPRGQMWHLRGLSNDGILGMNPVEYMRESIGIGLAAQDFGARFFANDGSPPGWIEMPGKWKDDAAAESFRQKWKSAQGGRRRGGTAVLEGGMQYHDLPLKNSDAQFLETRKFSVSDVARIFGVPPHMVGDMEGATFSNVEQQSLDYVVYTMTPIAEAWEASIEYSLLNEDDGLDPEFDMSRLLRGDQVARSAFYTKQFGLGALTTNEIRLKEGDNPVPEGDHRFVPVNLRLLEVEMENPPTPVPGHAPAPPGGSDPANPDGEGGDSSGQRESRTAALAFAAAARVARRELAIVSRAYKKGGIEAATAAYEAHAGFVAECLGVTKEAAELYCKLRKLALAPNVMETDFEIVARSRLERLALTGNPDYAR